MKVYELQHIAADEVRTLGFFSGVKKRDEAIEKYRKLEGFKDYPLSFITFERNMYDGKAVYSLQVFIRSEEQDFEYSHVIGVYAREADADNAAQSFIDRNRGNLEDEELAVELGIDTYKLDEMQYKCGFSSEE